MNKKLNKPCKRFKEKWLSCAKSACDFLYQNWSMVFALTCFATSIIYMFVAKDRTHAWGTVIAAMGSVLLALKYKLDQANYHKDLFEKRYEIYSTANKALWSWASDKKTNKETCANISDDFMGRAYYLFDKETYRFIKMLRGNLLKCHEDNKTETDKKADDWLSSWVDCPEEFRNKFKGLSISIYRH
jgi:hypothetical protein